MFYINPGGFSCGTDANWNVCHYLEAWTEDIGPGGVRWSGDAPPYVGTGLRIGTGAENTRRAVLKDPTADRAITLADSFVSPNGTADWFLPSREELDEMYFHKAVIGGFNDEDYWSSSESGEGAVWTSDFETGNQNGDDKIETQPLVRPVRAF